MTGTRPAALDPATGAYGFGPLALVATLSLMWGAGYPAMAVAMRWFEPLTLRCAVMLASGVILLLYAAATGQRLHLPRRQWRDLAVCALFNMTILQIGMTYGVYFVGAGRSSVLIYTMLIWTALFARLLLGEPLSARRVLALALGAAAVFALLAQNLSDVRDAPLGVVLNLIAAASFGFGTVWTKRTIWALDLSAMAGWQLVVGVVPLVAIWLVLAPPAVLGGVPVAGRRAGRRDPSDAVRRRAEQRANQRRCDSAKRRGRAGARLRRARARPIRAPAAPLTKPATGAPTPAYARL